MNKPGIRYFNDYSSLQHLRCVPYRQDGYSRRANPLRQTHSTTVKVQLIVEDLDIALFNLNHIVVILNQNNDHLERAALPADPAVSPLLFCCDALDSDASWGCIGTTGNTSPAVRKLDFSLAALLRARFLSFFSDVRLSLSSRFSCRLASFSCARASAA